MAARGVPARGFAADTEPRREAVGFVGDFEQQRGVVTAGGHHRVDEIANGLGEPRALRCREVGRVGKPGRRLGHLHGSFAALHPHD